MKMATIKVINLSNEIVKDVKSIKFERNKEEGTHTNIGTNNGTNQCTYCKKVFSRKDNLTRHIKTVDCNCFKEKTVQIRKRKSEVRGKQNSKKSKLMSEAESESESESKSPPSTISAHNFSVDKILAMFTDDEIENITAIIWGILVYREKLTWDVKNGDIFFLKEWIENTNICDLLQSTITGEMEKKGIYKFYLGLGKMELPSSYLCHPNSKRYFHNVNDFHLKHYVVDFQH